MSILDNRYFHWIYRHLAALLSIVLTTWILRFFEPILDIQIIALLYLLPVMINTVLWGLSPGILTGFFAFLLFNYYFFPPYHTFQVHQTQDLITLIIFLVVAVVISQLIGQAREGVRLAKIREWEATRMYELISSLAGLQDVPSIIRALADQTLETFQLKRVEVIISNQEEGSSLIVSVPEGTTVKESPKKTIVLHTARGKEGELRIWFSRSTLSSEENRLMETYASQAALSLERIRLTEGENKARVLEESDRLKSSLLNSVSHELRTPLAAIKASISSLRSREIDWNTTARGELLATVEEETDHLNLLVGNLLDMSRIESGALQLHRRWNSIWEIAMGVVTKMRIQLVDHHLEMDFPENLPLIPTDYVLIEQVWTNLISNSIKYASPGTTIRLSARKETDHLHMQVVNQSPQVPEEHLERIFEKFYRVTEADRVTGTGLGLSICKGIVEAHGGKIWAENQDSFFVFHFSLPLTLNGAYPQIPRDDGDG